MTIPRRKAHPAGRPAEPGAVEDVVTLDRTPASERAARLAEREAMREELDERRELLQVLRGLHGAVAVRAVS